MSKNRIKPRQGWRASTFSENSTRTIAIDRLANWLGSRSRLLRSVMAAFIALVITGTIALIEYSYVLTLSPTSPIYAMLDTPAWLTINVLILALIGMTLYWIGWRLMIGFDLGEVPLRPGRAAAAWLLFGSILFITTCIFSAITVLDVMR
jgi:hypothetical protein